MCTPGSRYWRILATVCRLPSLGNDVYENISAQPAKQRRCDEIAGDPLVVSGARAIREHRELRSSNFLTVKIVLAMQIVMPEWSGSETDFPRLSAGVCTWKPKLCAALFHARRHARGFLILITGTSRAPVPRPFRPTPSRPHPPHDFQTPDIAKSNFRSGYALPILRRIFIAICTGTPGQRFAPTAAYSPEPAFSGFILRAQPPARYIARFSTEADALNHHGKSFRRNHCL